MSTHPQLCHFPHEEPDSPRGRRVTAAGVQIVRAACMAAGRDPNGPDFERFMEAVLPGAETFYNLGWLDAEHALFEPRGAN